MNTLAIRIVFAVVVVATGVVAMQMPAVQSVSSQSLQAVIGADTIQAICSHPQQLVCEDVNETYCNQDPPSCTGGCMPDCSNNNQYYVCKYDPSSECTVALIQPNCGTKTVKPCEVVPGNPPFYDDYCGCDSDGEPNSAGTCDNPTKCVP